MTYLRGQGPRLVKVCDNGGVKCVKSSVCISYEQPLISKDHNYTNTINVQQILVVTFEFTGAARGVNKVGQHWCRPIIGTHSLTSSIGINER